MRWLYLHFPQLQLDALDRQRDTGDMGDTATRPQTSACIIVHPEHYGVCQLDEQARHQGVKIGMGLATASALCHPLTIIRLDPSFERQRLQELAQHLYQITADIALFEPDGMVLEVDAMLNLYGTLDAYLDAIQSLLQQQGVSARLALADTPLAARTLARHASSTFSRDSSAISRQLDVLPLEALELPSRQREQLRRLGLHRLTDIEALSRKELGVRFGASLLHSLDQLRGKRPTPLHFYQPREVFSHSMQLEYEIRHSDALLFPSQRLLQQLQQFLQIASARIQSLRLILGFREAGEQCLELHSAEPERQSAVWRQLLQLKLERVRLQAPVIQLRLESGPLLSEQAQHPDLFAARQRLSPGHLISRLQAKLGQDALHRIQVQEDYRPEHAFSYHGVDSTQSPPASHHMLEHCVRPSLLLEKPERLSDTIRIIHGPERIQTAWWSEHAICRDYFVATNAKGQTLWVFRDPQQNWFVHGLFA